MSELINKFENSLFYFSFIFHFQFHFHCSICSATTVALSRIIIYGRMPWKTTVGDKCCSNGMHGCHNNNKHVRKTNKSVLL